MDNIFEVKLSNFLESFDVIECLLKVENCENYSQDTVVYTTNQIWYRGYNYKVDYVVCYEMGPIFPKFGIISSFLVISENKCLMVLKEIDVEHFDGHYFGFKIILKDIIVLVNVENLIIHECMEIHRNCKTDGLFLVTRHYL